MRFHDRASKPARGPMDILRWRFGKKDPRRPDHEELDRVRPRVVDTGLAALHSGEPPARLRAYWRCHDLPDHRLWILDVGEARPLQNGAGHRRGDP